MFVFVALYWSYCIFWGIKGALTSKTATDYMLAGRGILYIGTGVSGGEEGALKGPSIMPGGTEAAWPGGPQDYLP